MWNFPELAESKPKLNFLHLHSTSILQQLRLEEALLRVSNENWFIYNEGSSPAIVLGISGNVKHLVNLEQAEKLHLPLIRRFSGGGTVVVDQDTLFTTFICQHDAIPITAYPEPVMRWTGGFFSQAFNTLPFALRENDYVLHQRKCGGNAQYFTKDRWLHHTSFLWDYNSDYMGALALPQKMPSYREKRSHEDFICTLKPHLSSKAALEQGVKRELARYFQVQAVTEEEAKSYLALKHRQATKVLSYENFRPVSASAV